MSDFLSPILQWINAHPQWAGFATFIISAAESIAIIGTIVPGTVMMTAVGTLAGAGVMPLWSTIIWAILGAIVGDGISYWIGYHFKDHLHDVWPFRKYPSILANGEKFFHKHGSMSVFIGRFVGPVRALVPLVAGMLKMKPWRFLIANVASAIGWAPAYMLPGIALGAASLELPPDIAVHAILMLLLVGLFILFCLWFIQKLFWLIGNQINAALTRSWIRLRKSRYFSPITTLLKHHNPYKTYGQLTLAFYFIITSFLFLYLASYVGVHGSDSIFVNNFFYHLFRSLRTPNGDAIMVGITFLGYSKVLYLVAAALVVWLGWTRRWRLAGHVFVIAILTCISIETFKHWINSMRPWGIIQSPKGASFPSGHTTCAVVFYLGLAMLLVQAFHQHYRRLIYGIAFIIIAAISISRLYLGAHWFTDVLGGLLLGAAVLMLGVLSFNRQAESDIQPKGIILTTLLALLVVYSGFYFFTAKNLKNNSTLMDWPTYTIEMNDWWNQKGEYLPLYRINRFGLSQQVLNLQWMGNLEGIKHLSLQNGWETPAETDWITVIHRMSDIQSAEHLPLVSPLYLDKKPVLVLVKHPNGNKKLVVLRLWSPNIVIRNTNQPLWVGVVESVPRTYSWLFPHKHSNYINSLNSKLLAPSLANQYELKQVTVPSIQKHEKQQIVLIKPKQI